MKLKILHYWKDFIKEKLLRRKLNQEKKNEKIDNVLKKFIKNY